MAHMIEQNYFLGADHVDNKTILIYLSDGTYRCVTPAIVEELEPVEMATPVSAVGTFISEDEPNEFSV